MQLYKSDSEFKQKNTLSLLLKVCVLVILILPSVGAVKRFIVDKGFVSEHLSSTDKAIQLLHSVVLAPKNWFLANNDLDLIKLDIKYDDWLKLVEDRRKALANGVISEERHEVSATVQFNDHHYRAKIRLQGDMLDHVNKPDRWSLKVSLKNKHAILAARKFALFAPSVRINQGPSLFAKTLALAGFDIVSPSHTPVNVVVNGVDWGTMFFEQSFSQELLAVNNRTEGLIVRFDLVGQETTAKGEIIRTLKPRSLQTSKILANHSLAKQRKIALTLVNDFLTEKRPASDVFDAKRLGQYLATVDLWGAWHALTWNNWRWYYNPHTAKLEPIQSDVAVTPAAHIWLMKPPSKRFVLSAAMLQDSEVNRHYLDAKHHLLELLNGDMQQQLAAYDAQFIRQFHRQSPLVNSFNLATMKQQAECWHNNYTSTACQDVSELSEQLHQQMDFYKAKLNWDLAALLQSKNGQLRWQVTNNHEQPLYIRAIEGVISGQEVSSLDRVNDDFPLTIMPQQSTQIELPRQLKAINVRASLAKQKAQNYHFVKDTAPLSFLPRASNVNELPEQYREFIIMRDGAWLFKPGKWQVDHHLVTPANTHVMIPAGTQLQFAKHAGLMVFGSIEVNGSEKKPVVFTKQAEFTQWSGLAVFAKQVHSINRLSHLNISFASSPKLGHWQPRGAIYFVFGGVEMDHVSITDNQSEDGLNIINAKVAIDHLTIENALSDAFDCDFCQGNVNNSRFTNIGFRSGGDGIDVSGSQLTIRNSHFENVRDKAISAGEHSELNVANVSLNKVNFGLVAKDDSEIRAQDISASNIRHQALMSYSKKAIFGPAKLTVSSFNCSDENCFDKISAETGSVLVVNNQTILSKALDVKKMYNTIMKSDKPR